MKKKIYHIHFVEKDTHYFHVVLASKDEVEILGTQRTLSSLLALYPEWKEAEIINFEVEESEDEK